MRYLIVSILLSCLSISSLVSANILATRGKYQLSQADFNKMIFAGEKIAQHVFTPTEKKRLQQWLVDVFHNTSTPEGVKKGIKLYHSYIQLAKKQRTRDDQQLIWHHLYRELIFKWRFKTYKTGQITLLDVIDRYNPVIAKLPKQQLILLKKDHVLVRQGDYFLSTPMWLALKRTADFLSNTKLPTKTNLKMKQWALADFKHTPKTSSNFYTYLLDKVVPHYYSTQNELNRNKFRLNTYAQFYFSFKKDNFAKQWKNDLMDVVTQYHPLLSTNETYQQITTREGSSTAIKPITAQELALQNQIFRQTLQLNQNAFNSMMRQSQRVHDSINQSMTDFSTQQNIHLSGDKVITTYDHYYLIEKPNGDRYELSR